MFFTFFALLMDLPLLLVCFVLYPFGRWFPDPLSAHCDPNQVPIVLVHGYLHNKTAWVVFRYRLKSAGIRNVFTLSLGNPLLPIEEYAARLARKIEEIRRLTGHQDLHLIGHSMGGIVSSYYALHLAQAAGVQVRSIVTLGSPLNGTKLYGIGVGPKQMHYGSHFITTLRAKILASSIPFFTLGSLSDPVIRPPLSAILPERKHFLFRIYGHMAFLFFESTFKRVLEFLLNLGISEKRTGF